MITPYGRMITRYRLYFADAKSAGARAMLTGNTKRYDLMQNAACGILSSYIFDECAPSTLLPLHHNENAARRIIEVRVLSSIIMPEFYLKQSISP